MTGFSNKLRCVSRWNCLNASRSASSAKLLAVRIKVSSCGIELCKDACIVLTRFRARRSVRRRGERGKLVRTEMSLSVKSIASCWSYRVLFSEYGPFSMRCFEAEQILGRMLGSGRSPVSIGISTYFCNTEILNLGDLVACGIHEIRYQRCSFLKV